MKPNPNPYTLHGSCHCHAITYTLSVPALHERPIAIPAAQNPAAGTAGTADASTVGDANRRWPVVELDHCTDCRGASGAPVMAFVFVPAGWVVFRMLVRDESVNGDGGVGAEGRGEGERVVMRADEVVVGRAQMRRMGVRENVGAIPAERTWARHYASSEGVTRTFCGRCGTGIAFSSAKKMMEAIPRIDLTLGSLVDLAEGEVGGSLGAYFGDGEKKEETAMGGLVPDWNVWWGSGVNWVKELIMGRAAGELGRWRALQGQREIVIQDELALGRS